MIHWRDKLFGRHYITHPEIVVAEEDFKTMDKEAEKDERMRAGMKARIAYLDAELDNILRRGGYFKGDPNSHYFST